MPAKTNLYIKKLNNQLDSYNEFYKIVIEDNIDLTEDEFYCATSWINYFKEHIENMVDFLPPKIQLPNISKNTVIDFGLSHVSYAIKGQTEEKHYIIYIKKNKTKTNQSL